jgi:hypothetical protein
MPPPSYNREECLMFIAQKFHTAPPEIKKLILEQIVRFGVKIGSNGGFPCARTSDMTTDQLNLIVYFL